MHSNSETKSLHWQRLKLLIVSRLVILFVFFLVTFILGAVSPAISVSPALLNFIYAVIIAMFLFSLVYTLLLRKEKYFRVNLYIQLMIDIGLISFLVYVTGSIGSNYSLLYSLVIIYSAIFLGRRGALVVASFCALAYGLVIDLEYFKIIPTFYTTGRDYTVEASDVLVRLTVHILSFYILAFLASIVVEQEKKTRSLLEERESAFNQLDLLFRSIIESVDTGVMTTTLQGRIKTFNRAAENITGYPHKTVENKPIQDLFPDIAGYFETGIQNQIRNRREINIVNSKGYPVILGCSISALKDRQGTQIGYILIFQDLTEIKRMEDKLQQSKKLALIGEMAAGLAHEMRNPLASIAGSIELLGQTANLDDTDKRLMQIILRGKEQLDHFVRDFLLLARPLPETRESVRVDEMVDEIMEQIKMSKDWMPGIHVIKVFPGQVRACTNKEQLRQIIQNLILNALQAMEGEGKLKLEIFSVKLEDEKDYTAFQVSDNGCGIEEKDLKNVLEPFFTNKEKGTGLGLAIVSRLVDGYGGKIKIESQVNLGTTVTIWLPAN
jgi:two-component system sensor histidine kinase PilS (NtrC family)